MNAISTTSLVITLPSVMSPGDPPGCTATAAAPAPGQLHRPSSAISDGTRNALTTVASTSTPAAMPIPSSLMKMICDVANAPIAT
jgi:hypothetical protein